MAALLFVFPGFECKGFAWGFIAGYWPLLIPWRPFQFLLGHDWMALLSMFVFSGLEIGLCAWLARKAGSRAWIPIFIVVSILVAAAYFTIGGISYEQWQRVPAIQQAIHSPEISYQPTRSDYFKTIAIPRALAGGMIGLYFATGLCSIIAVAKLGWNRALQAKIKPTQGDDHGRTTSRVTATD